MNTNLQALIEFQHDQFYVNPLFALTLTSHHSNYPQLTPKRSSMISYNLNIKRVRLLVMVNIYSKVSRQEGSYKWF